jgi:hypothetical protein
MNSVVTKVNFEKKSDLSKTVINVCGSLSSGKYFNGKIEIMSIEHINILEVMQLMQSNHEGTSYFIHKNEIYEIYKIDIMIFDEEIILNNDSCSYHEYNIPSCIWAFFIGMISANL